MIDKTSLLIIGGGPAGLNAALHAAENLTMILKITSKIIFNWQKKQQKILIYQQNKLLQQIFKML